MQEWSIVHQKSSFCVIFEHFAWATIHSKGSFKIVILTQRRRLIFSLNGSINRYQDTWALAVHHGINDIRGKPKQVQTCLLKYDGREPRTSYAHIKNGRPTGRKQQKTFKIAFFFSPQIPDVFVTLWCSPYEQSMQTFILQHHCLDWILFTRTFGQVKQIKFQLYEYLVRH